MNQARNSPVGFYVRVIHVPYLEVNKQFHFVMWNRKGHFMKMMRIRPHVMYLLRSNFKIVSTIRFIYEFSYF